MPESFAIIGSGAVGSYYGARLAQHGHDVHFLVRSDFEAVSRNGLQIKSFAGDFSVPAEAIKVYREAVQMPKVNWVIVALKTTHNDLFKELISPAVGDSTAVLTLQNGLGNEEMLANLFGNERILGGVAFTCINRVGPGRVEHTAHGHIRLGEFRGGPSPRAIKLAELFKSSGIPCDVLPSIIYGRWEKLVWNFPFNGLSAVLDQTTEQLLSTEPGENLVRGLMAEVVACARANDVALPDSLIDLNVTKTKEMGAYRTSMYVDRHEGRDLEVEAILGQPTRAGTARGVDNFRMRVLYELACMTRMQVLHKSGAKS